jgi:flagellar biosynthesis anti-sigma factor FlgM
MKPLSSTSSHAVQPSLSKPPLQASAKHKSIIAHHTSPHELESVSISQAGKEISQYTEAMRHLPDIRQERIAQIQTALQEGTYTVSSEDLADTLIQELSNNPSSSPSSPS